MGGGDGDEPMPLSATVDAMERLHDYEDLDRAMRGRLPGRVARRRRRGRASRRILGEPAVRDLRRLKEIERALGEGRAWCTRRNGRLEVTPRGARKLGERALVQVFEELKRDREGTHDARDAGGMAEPTGATRPWRFGDNGQIAVQRTVFNAVVRSRAGAAASACSPTTSSWSRPSSAPRPRRRSCWICRSACRCAATSCTRRRWRWRCTR